MDLCADRSARVVGGMSCLQAGYELDALVAEKVMEWPIREQFELEPYEIQCIRHGEGLILHIPLHNAVKGWTHQTFRPSISIADAWQVVEHFTYLYLFHSRPPFDQWECKLVEQDERRYYGTSATAPLAICIAALKAVGVSVE